MTMPSIATAREAFLQRMRARTIGGAAERAALLSPLRETLRQLLDPALVEARAAALVQLQVTQADLQAARAELASHEQTPPATREGLDTWARRRGELRDRGEGLQLLARQAEEAHQQAAHALDMAGQAAFLAEHARRVEAWRAARQQAAEAIAEVERQAAAQIAALDASVGPVRLALDTWRNLSEELDVDGRALAIEEDVRGGNGY